MKDNSIESKLRSAVSHAAPDALDDILSACDHEKGKVIYMEKKRTSPLRGFAAVAAVLVLLIAGAFVFKSLGGASNTLAAVVSLDVNPSIELNVDKNENVLSARGLNADGKTVLGDMQLEGSKLDVAVNAIIGSMLQKGYLDDMANSILLSVSGVDGYNAEALRSQLASDVNKQLKNCAVLSQDVSSADSETVKLAEKYDITVGKAELIRQIVKADPRHSFDELSELSINELNLLADGKSLGSIDSTGKASSKAYIGSDAALDIALSHAKLGKNDVRNIEVELDYEYGSMVYEVEFESGAVEYEYDINAADGDIVWYEKDSGGRIEQGGSAVDGNDAVGKEKATQTALKHAGLSSSQVTELEVKLDRDGGRLVYEIEFRVSGCEYEYEINASNGSIIKSEKELDD